MRVFRDFKSEADMAAAAADSVAAALRAVLEAKREATVMFATGVSQLEFLAELVRRPSIGWQRVRMCHLDEYVGIGPDHPAGFVCYLQKNLLAHISFAETILIDGLADPAAECDRLNRLLPSGSVDLALVGIGENGHIAFNDPPADFAVRDSFIVVELDEACRRQQVGEGWFPDIDAVPAKAISASVNFVLAAGTISCVVPGRRKAEAVRDCLQGEISPLAPASVLRRHGDVTIYLDEPSASLLE